jgi:type I restriction enzyme, S subunit
MRKRGSNEMKETNLSYIGEIPIIWDLLPNKLLLKLIKNKVGDKASHYQMLSLTKRGVIVRDISQNKGKFSASNEGYQVIEPNDVIFCLFDIEETPRTVGLAKDSGIITNAYSAFKTTDLITPEYVTYLYQYIDDSKLLKPFYSGLRNTIRPPVFGNILSPVPPLDEQQRITAFLDARTAKIDALSSELTAFKANLLLQKRSLVSECVTKGIPSERDRAYKDSGVEWLGEIPAGWEVNKINRIVKFFTGATPPTGDADSYDGDKLWANISDVGSHYISEASKTISEAAARKSNIMESPVDSLLFSFKLSLGKVSIVKEPMYTNEAIATFLKNDRIVTNWAYYAFPIYIPENSKINIYGSPLLNADLIKSAKIAVPPLDEQKRIADYLDVECARIDALIGEIDNQVNLLKTYRKSLINEVVTGKVEV